MNSKKNKKHPIILALDTDCLEKVTKFKKLFSPYIDYIKIGSPLFTKFGSKVIDIIKKENINIFLDLKFHDIPSTVFNACYQSTLLGVNMLTIHLMGGKEMIEKAIEGVKKAQKKTKQKCLVLGVMVLTSFDESLFQSTFLTDEKIKDYMLHLVTIGNKAGIDGFICSPKEVAYFKKKFPKKYGLHLALEIKAKMKLLIKKEFQQQNKLFKQVQISSL